MEVLLRVVLPVFSALGSALLSFWVTRARMEAAFAKEREAMADRRIALLEQYIKDREEAGKRYRSGEVARDFRLEVRMIHEKTIAPSIDAPPALPSREQYSAGTKPRRALPSKTEGVLALAHEDPNLKPAEIARALGLKPGTVRVALHRHRKTRVKAQRT